jgi:hypothetical protein
MIIGRPKPQAPTRVANSGATASRTSRDAPAAGRPLVAIPSDRRPLVLANRLKGLWLRSAALAVGNRALVLR